MIEQIKNFYLTFPHCLTVERLNDRHGFNVPRFCAMQFADYAL